MLTVAIRFNPDFEHRPNHFNLCHVLGKSVYPRPQPEELCQIYVKGPGALVHLTIHVRAL